MAKPDRVTERIIDQFQLAVKVHTQCGPMPSLVDTLDKARKALTKRIDKIRQTKFQKALQKALYAELERLMTPDLAPNSRDGYYLLKLAALISKVESQHFKFGKRIFKGKVKKKRV